MLKKLGTSDEDSLLDLVNNEKVYRYLPSFLHERQYTDMGEMIRDLYGKCFAEKSVLIVGIYLKEDMDLCGLAEFYEYKPAVRKISIGCRLREQYWGKGLAAETTALMTEYLFSSTDIERITASTMTANRASARTLKKIGFIRIAASVPEDWGYNEPVIADKWVRYKEPKEDII